MTTPLGFTLTWSDRLLDDEPALEASLPTLNAFQRTTGLGLRGASRIRFLLVLLRAARVAEDTGRLERADFLWTELHHRLRDCWSDDAAWVQAADTLPARTPAVDGPALRARYALESVLAQHCARVNGRLAQGEHLNANDRAFFHAGCIGTLLTLDGDDLQPARHLATEVELLRIDALRRARRLDEAINKCAELAAREGAPAVHAELLAELHTERALGALQGGDDEAAQRADAARLHRWIEPFERDRLKHQRAIGFYRGLARCQRMLGVCLANSGEPAEALGALRLARLYDPHFDDVLRDEQQLEEIMNRLQAQMADVRRQLAAQPGSQLNADGQRMRRNAERGFADREQVDGSPLAASLRRDFTRAHDRDLWGVVGLAAPADAWDDRAQALREALVPLFNDLNPASATAVQAARGAAKVGQPLLADVDDVAVTAFLRRRLFDEPQPEVPSPTQPAATVAPVPPVSTPAPRRSLEPAVLWLFSRQALVAKAVAGGVLTLLLVALGVQWREASVRSVRDEAWLALQAGARGDPGAVLRAAETYFSVRPWTADGRAVQARQLYDAAFANWFVAQGYALDDASRTRIKRYHGLLSSEVRR